MLETVCRLDDLEVIKYKPTILKPFLIDMEPTTVLRRIRFLIDWFYGYSVYYLKKESVFLGYCTVTSGKNPRFWFSEDCDIVVGPYYIEDKYRGKGYATKLVNAVITHCEKGWKKAYLYIKNSNQASIKVVEHLGGQFLFHVHNTRTKKLVKTDSGEYGIYMIRSFSSL